MPQELLAFPPLYVVVGIYRLFTDAPLRAAIWAKVKHGTIRGLAVGSAYAVLTWPAQSWVVKTFFVGGGGLKWFAMGGVARKGDVGREVVERGFGWLKEMDIVTYTTLLFLLPQLTYVLNFFLRRNLKLARSRAWDLTVHSRGKPETFWSKGYIEEYEDPPRVHGMGAKIGESGEGKGTKGAQQERWLKWILWTPSQMLIRHFVLIPLSPSLPLLNTISTCSLRGLYTARVLHRPYFDVKKMGTAEQELWLEERKWAYRSFGFAASLLESIPIISPYISITNRIGAAMWAFDLEKRQHRVANGETRKLRKEDLNILGMQRVELPGREEEFELTERNEFGHEKAM